MATIYPVAAERSALAKPRIVCSLSFAAAERKVKKGQLARVYDDQRVLVGYERIPVVPEPFMPEPVAAKVAIEVFRPSPASITASEMEINAYQYFRDGLSRTAHLHPDSAKRFARVAAKTGRTLPPEDRVELVAEKVKQFGKSRVVCARERLGLEDRVSA